MDKIPRSQLSSLESGFPIELLVSMGLLQGYDVIDKFGGAFNITGDSVVQDCWEHGTEYTFSTTPDIDKLSSSSVLDVGHLIQIEGIEDPETSTGKSKGYAVLNGQNKVDIYDNSDLEGDPITFWRVFRMENMAKSTDYGGLGSLNGMVYCYVDGAITAGVPDVDANIRAEINDGNNQTLMSIYTLPPKKVGFLFRGEIGMELDVRFTSGSEFIRAQYQSRRYEKIFKVKKTISLISSGTSIYSDKRSFADILPGLTDIKITKTVASIAMGMFATFDILLIDEDRFSDEYLKEIGQPGY